jgi:hypothetical protein
MRSFTRSLLIGFISLIASHSSAAPDSDALGKILAIGPEGKGNAEAGQAWQQLATLPPSELTALLTAMDGANSLSQNWLRAAIETIATRAHKENQLPQQDLTAFIADTRHDDAPRLLAYELLLRHSPQQAEQVRPNLLHDPAAELRIYPVETLIQKGQKHLADNQNPQAIEAFQTALSGARDQDQINTLAEHLRKLDQQVDLPTHFGFLMSWHLIAPFTNVERKGFDTVFPPEQNIDLNASYPGKGQQATWKPFTSQEDNGIIDFNKAFDSLKEVTGYAHTVFHATEERPAELRLGCKNGWKIWFNGQLLFGRDEYHRGMKMDQYKFPVTLQKGPNTILVKCCQNEQTETWTAEWNFQLRICDSTGTAILSAQP